MRDDEIAENSELWSCVFNYCRLFGIHTNWLKEGAIKLDLRVHAWVFMTNHVH